jgi:hypothetical protein
MKTAVERRAFIKLYVDNTTYALVAEDLDLEPAELDTYAHDLGLVGVFVTRVDAAGMREYAAGITTEQNAHRFRPRTLKPDYRIFVAQAEAFIRANIYECVKELIELEETGLIKEGGRIRELSSILQNVKSNPLSLAESMVKSVAFRSLINHIDWHNL